jgi:C4-dicarboxylate-specific signal transduction histidine kinase
MCSDNLPAWLTFILMAVVSLAVARWLNGRLDRWLFQFPAAAAARAAAHGVARTATTTEELRQEFERVVAGWAHAEKALFAAVVPHEPVATTEWSLATGNPVLGTLREIHWATPERLQRERSTPGREAVRAFLTAHGLGAVVVGRGESVTVLMAVGLKPTRRPFTYPEIEQLIELAEIAEAALSRVRLTEQAVQREKLATLGLLGASLAHEIRNPLYAIRAFAELLPDNYDRTEFREQFAGMVGTEVVRIDQLISQLMNLAAPRKLSATAVRLHDVIREAVALVAPKARASGIAWETRLRAEDDCVHADRAATKQVLLNLCLNAIQAQENDGTAEGWVKVSTVDRADGVELTVSDGGPGIAEALRDRLFEPFQTTHAGGLGLGLSISREILAHFGATLNVDPPREDEGAVFHVVFQRSDCADTPEYDLRPAPACVI